MNQSPTLSEALVRTLVKFPQHILAYVVGLIVATLDDYTLITLAVLSMLSGIALGSILMGFLIYFGGYFVVRLVSAINEVLGFGARNLSAAVINLNPPIEPPPLP